MELERIVRQKMHYACGKDTPQCPPILQGIAPSPIPLPLYLFEFGKHGFGAVHEAFGLFQFESRIGEVRVSGVLRCHCSIWRCCGKMNEYKTRKLQKVVSFFQIVFAQYDPEKVSRPPTNRVVHALQASSPWPWPSP